MKKQIISIALTSAGLMMAASSAFASDGTITVKGSITSSTCKINSGSNDVTVNLPQVRTAALASVGAVAGRTPFQMSLTDCPTASGSPSKVGVYFEPGASVDLTTGRLIPDAGTGKATGVQVNVLNDQQQQIKIGSASSNSQMVAVDDKGSATLNYFAEYYAKDATVAAGSVNTRVQYSLIYQ
ncbi:fimbrial protein [Burkholderia ubonensis]|uniref:fimbrial protein n=1 Tax=Burkholderia ubonensis TaxID=101571 RepID=UPI002ABE00A6|nr:fimbrial protein [Burkholderia ubonensis]